MINADLLKTKSLIEAEGVFVAVQPDDSLFVGVSPQTTGGLQVFKESIAVFHCNDGWHCVFPGEGMSTYRVDGDLGELTSLVVQVIRESNKTGCGWSKVFQQLVPEHAAYLCPVS